MFACETAMVLQEPISLLHAHIPKGSSVKAVLKVNCLEENSAK